MRLIKRLKIRYFRSAYTISLEKCRDLNIISGRNDVGKSNILKALNLFFNSKTDWGEDFSFYRDFSVKRLQQVRKETVKGKQFVSIEIEFECPTNYKNSLPQNFIVTRTWLRDSRRYQETNNLEYLVKRKLLPASLDTAKRFLSQFLNRIHFEYVPAVKDRAYFTHLLATLQARLLESPLDKNAGGLVNSLAANISNQIEQLQSDFQRATSIETFFVPPQELSSLFQSFLVSTKSKSNILSLSLRGDGIQARYVPSVLHYISSISNDFFIWGFEEPENSLEYSFVSSLGNDFESIYSKWAQIFIASHSPAFISLHDSSTACYRVFKNEDDSTNIFPIHYGQKLNEHKNLLMNELGVLEIQKEVHELYSEKIMKLKEISVQVSELQKDLDKFRKPILLVEGKFDKNIIETVWSKLFNNSKPPFIIRVADSAKSNQGGAAGASSVKMMIEALHPEDDRKIVGLFDRDEEGIKVFGSLSKNFVLISNSSDMKQHRNGMASAMLLPSPGFRNDHVNAKNLTIEFMFPDEVIFKKTVDGRGLVFSKPKPCFVLGSHRLQLSDNQINKSNFDFKGYERVESGKDIFSELIVPDCSKNECEAFRALFDNIKKLLER
jgi:predicted ATPase